MASVKIAAKNKKAYFDYFIVEKFEAGIVLKGTEVKSVRKGAVNLKDSFVSLNGTEVYIKNMHISPYEYGNVFNAEPLRERKLLLHKKEIIRLEGLSAQQGYTIVPLSLYFKDSRVKVEIALAKGKKLYDKRQDMAQKSAKREIDRAFKSATSGR